MSIAEPMIVRLKTVVLEHPETAVACLVRVFFHRSTVVLIFCQTDKAVVSGDAHQSTRILQFAGEETAWFGDTSTRPR
jgi:hypothetical protein